MDQYLTPIADALIRQRQDKFSSFHALPIYYENSICKSKLRKKYRILYGRQFFGSEMTISKPRFDSFFFPTGAIYRAQQLAAKAFSADRTLFSTCGTSISNAIAIDALCSSGSKVLVDRTCHQSIPFNLIRCGARITFLEFENSSMDSGRKHFDVSLFFKELELSIEQNDPFELIVLAGSSYEGVLINFTKLFIKAMPLVPDVTWLIDEAWSSYSYFHNRYEDFAALKAARKVSTNLAIKSNVIVTQSVHKSASALRQASFIHILGSQSIITQMEHSHYRNHSTSPSYPILASLDLARCQLALEGKAMIDNSLKLSELLKSQIQQSRLSEHYSICEESSNFLGGNEDPWFSVDPLKVAIDCKRLPISTAQIKENLDTLYGIYLPRFTSRCLLLNIHFGISELDINKLLKSLTDIASIYHGNLQPNLMLDQISDHYLIPYPPGVPVVYPGEKITSQVLKEFNELLDGGQRLFKVIT